MPIYLEARNVSARGFRFLVAVALTVMTAPAWADDTCPTFVGTPEFDEARGMIERGEFGYAEDVILPVFAGKGCDREQITVVMEALGFTKKDRFPPGPDRPGEFLADGVAYKYDFTLIFCHSPGYFWGFFRGCNGEAIVFFRDGKVVLFESAGQI